MPEKPETNVVSEEQSCYPSLERLGGARRKEKTGRKHVDGRDVTEETERSKEQSRDAGAGLSGALAENGEKSKS